MSNIENQNVEAPETRETSAPEQGMDANDRVDATAQDVDDAAWDSASGDLRNQPAYEPAGQEMTTSYAHANESRTEFANAPNARGDFNKAASSPEAAGGQTGKVETSDHNLNPPEQPAPDF
jgi:hypothetical protein